MRAAGMFAIGREPLDGGDGLSRHALDRNLAGIDRLAIEMYGARAASAGATAELRTGQPEVFAQHPEQWRARLCGDFDVLPIDRDCGHTCSLE